MTPSTNVSDFTDQINGLTTTKQSKTTINNTPELGTFASSFQLNSFNYSSFDLIRKPEVLSITCRSKAQHHIDINTGLMVPSVSIGMKSVAYVKHEVLAVVAAQISGKTKDEIRLLVKELVAQRQNLLNEVQL